MDVYGQPQPEVFLVDDLFNFPNEDIFSPNSTTTSTTNSTTDSDLPLPPHHSHHPHHHQHYAHNPYSYDYTTAFSYSTDFANNHTFPSTDFTDKLGVPSEDVAELEWLSNFVDDSSSEFPANYFAGTVNTSSFHSRSRTKRTRPATNATWTTSSTESHSQPPNSNINRSINTGRRRESSLTRDGPSADVERRCTHCGSEKTPQWRSGPLGPKTLCNACGVRYKSGRLVPEYRPAASPTFVLTQHSNSHRKVLELRRQKEMMHHQQQQTMQMQVVTPKVEASQQQDHQMYGFRHSQVC